MSDFVTKDSGERRRFNTGAQRDVVTDKGRYDLISPIMIERLAKLLQKSMTTEIGRRVCHYRYIWIRG